MEVLKERTTRPFEERFRGSVLSLAVVALLSACSDSSDSAPEAPVDPAVGAGTETRNWMPEDKAPATSPERFQVASEEFFMTVRDGTRLGGRLLLPQNVPGPARPCVLMANGYGHAGATGASLEPIVMDLAERGYAAVHISLRGSGNSEGEANLYNMFGEDGYDIVEWMADQPWCNGRVGMVGASLLGIVQWLTAKESPPSLKAIIPHVACGDCYDYLWYPGGMLPGPGRAAREGAEFDSAAAHRNFDAFWEERTTLREHHEQIAAAGIAVMTTGGWNDYISPANLQAFEELPDSAAKKMIWGPDAHGGSLADVDPWSFAEYQALWMDHHLRGIDNGVDREGQALIFVQGPDKWRLEEKWPIPDTRRVRLHLRAEQSGSIASLNDGALLAGPATGANASASINYSPDSGPFLPTHLGGSTGRFLGDQRPAEQNVLTWTTQPLDVATEITGWPELRFWASIAGTDADFVVQLTDVAPDGSSRQVTVGYLNAARADSRAQPQAPEQGTPRAYALRLWPTSYVFRAGHRIRLDLAGGAETGSGVTGPQGPGKSPYTAQITLFQDQQRQSVLELPVIGTGGEPLLQD